MEIYIHRDRATIEDQNYVVIIRTLRNIIAKIETQNKFILSREIQEQLGKFLKEKKKNIM